MPFLPATQERRLISGEREREEVGREGERERMSPRRWLCGPGVKALSISSFIVTDVGEGAPLCSLPDAL